MARDAFDVHEENRLSELELNYLKTYLTTSKRF